MRLWVSDFGGVSDEERDGEVEVGGGYEALHHGTVRQRDREWESERGLTREKIRKKMIFFFLITVFLIFYNYQKRRRSQNDVVLAHLRVVDNWDLTEYLIDNNWKL